ncbi:hypothetical protein HanRHA438_Chr05g0214641 [Helianthus annuus]|uniref:Uncharacterized protein n=1 Tax=Helianthus annuus TaxID=4232 RepID=A0A9K3IXK5_HELAN|nr:hypothetical protein HanXRQr2_Chr05g0204971 [Helianthus annuus]KAJ0569612.1 hypothetical protein HanHA300_Chr05g0168251 [Helianthus annuus]KAJ0583922.1 hypothetical protein HanHA89_Chr05g0182301 [Helianthus annuus]KAJ0918172.1 hypothetical protein HanRHA438_Chr05g0214641 [Helianthus annuus]KAJ0921949.1 hypothetical protein HanPSC8_Chr05g0197741 [Helianthus annuus]
MCLLVLFFINGCSIDVLLNLDYAWFVIFGDIATIVKVVRGG